MYRLMCVECKNKWEGDAGETCLECGGQSLAVDAWPETPKKTPEMLEHRTEMAEVDDSKIEHGIDYGSVEGPVLSIVMPVLNQLPFTRKILDQLGHHTDVPFEVIVVDNGSDDGTSEFLREKMLEMPQKISLCTGFTLITNDGNTGVSKSWNQGCRNAYGVYMAVINNDVLVPDRWASKVIEAFETDPDLWAVSPIFTRLAPPEDWEERNLKHMGEPLRLKPAAAPGTVGGFCGFFFILSRTAWEEVGEFDEQFMLWYNDTDFWHRLQAKGHPAMQLQNVLIHHFESQTLMTIPNLNERLYAEGVLYKKKWGSQGRNDEMADVRYSTGCVIAVPSRGPIDILHEQHMINLVMRSPIGLSIAVITARGMEIAEARNFLAREAIKGRSKWLMFIDDDTFVPLTVLSRMCLELDNPITTGVVYSKTDPAYPCIFQEDDVGPWIDYKPGQIVKIRRAGLACTCIRTEVFEQIEQPWFKSGYRYQDIKGAEHFVKAGEDFYFYDKARQAGVDAYVDTSILCDHYDAVTNKWYPPPEQVAELIAKNQEAYKNVIKEQTAMGVPAPEPRTEIEARGEDAASVGKESN